MATNTTNLKLLKKDPIADGDDTFNIETMLNENWDKIDTAVKGVQDDIDGIVIPDATTAQKGIVQLTNATDSTSETTAPTAKALKTVSDAAFPKVGGDISGSVSVAGTISANNTVIASGGISVILDSNNNSTRRWAQHIDAGSSLYLAPSDTNDSNDFNFSKGIVIRGGDTKIVNNGRVILDEIDAVKQSGVDRKSELATALNAKNVAANNQEAFSTLISKVGNISPITKSGGTGNVLNDASGQYQGDDNQRHFQWTPQGNATRDYVFALGDFPYQVGYGCLYLSNVQVVINSSQGITNFPSGYVDNFTQLQTSTTAAVYFNVVGYGKGTITLRVTFNANRATDIRFSCNLYRASGI